MDYGNDFKDLGIVEAMAYGRYYLPVNTGACRLWAQMGIGAIVFMREGKDFISSVMVDMSLGGRFSLGNFYGEPYIRAGYPVLIGAGAVFGYRF